MPDAVTVRTPSTIGNFGPGFDVTSLAVACGGDTLTATPADTDAIEVVGAGTQHVPGSFAENCAAVAFGWLRDRYAPDSRFTLALAKGVPPGSGLGSSASSSAAGALAFARAHPDITDWTVNDLVEAASYGEAQVAGRHGDDVAAAIQGGLSLVAPGHVGRVDPPTNLWLAIVLPDLRLDTRAMRDVLPAEVPLAQVVANLGRLATIIDASHRNDASTIGAALQDDVAAPGRRSRLPHHDAVIAAAVEAGAASCSIAGSGPAMFAALDDEARARSTAKAMAAAVEDRGLAARAIVARPAFDDVAAQIDPARRPLPPYPTLDEAKA